ncbi:ArsR/SmtB family transcription factor [Candidatus Hodarchaeum mangrovi]
MSFELTEMDLNGGEDSLLELQANLCQSLTHPFRLKLLYLLKDGEKNVNTIQELTKERQPFISQHLKVLRDKGVVNTRREHNEVYYSLADLKILKICRIVEEMIKEQHVIESE